LVQHPVISLPSASVGNGTDIAALAMIRMVFREALILAKRVGADSLH